MLGKGQAFATVTLRILDFVLRERGFERDSCHIFLLEREVGSIEGSKTRGKETG